MNIDSRNNINQESLNLSYLIDIISVTKNMDHSEKKDSDFIKFIKTLIDDKSTKCSSYLEGLNIPGDTKKIRLLIITKNILKYYLLFQENNYLYLRENSKKYILYKNKSLDHSTNKKLLDQHIKRILIKKLKTLNIKNTDFNPNILLKFLSLYPKN